MRATLLLLVGAIVVAIVIYAASSRSGSVSKVAPVKLAEHTPPAKAKPEPNLRASAVAATSDLDRQIDEKLAADPIAQAIPMLFDLSKQKQLETLYWMKAVPRDKLLQFFPRFADGTELSPAERRKLALDTIDGFIKDLEQQGIKAPRF